VLLLDEPLAAVDPRTRAEVRRVLRGLPDEPSAVRLLVSHDPIEAMALCDRLVVLEAGRVVQDAGAAEIRARPRTAYAAGFVGLTLLRGHAVGGQVALPGGAVAVHAGPPAPSGEVLVAFHPRTVSLHVRAPEGSARNVWAGVVDEVVPAG